MSTISSYFNDLPLADSINAVVALGLGAAGHIAWQALKDYARGHKQQIEQVVVELVEDVLDQEQAAADTKAADATEYAPGEAPALTREDQPEEATA